MTPTTMATCPTSGGGSYQTMMSPGMGSPRCDGGAVAEGTSSQPGRCWYSDQKSMALPAAGKGEPASAKAPVTSSTHCRLPFLPIYPAARPTGTGTSPELQHRLWHARIVPGIRVAVEMGRDGERRLCYAAAVSGCRVAGDSSRRRRRCGRCEMLAVLVAVPGTQTPPL